MRYIMVMLATIVLLGGYASPAFADGCFLCEGGGYVAFTGDDTFDKRKKAKEQFGCTVSGTTSSCSNPKGTVSWLPAAQEVYAALGSQMTEVVAQRSDDSH
jgi:hypothetical protein